MRVGVDVDVGVVVGLSAVRVVGVSLLLQLIFQSLALFQNKTKTSGLEFIADNRSITSSITGERCS